MRVVAGQSVASRNSLVRVKNIHHGVALGNNYPPFIAGRGVLQVEIM